MNKIFPWNIVIYQLYLYQLEEYEEDRFVKAITHKGLLPSKSLRKTLKWTTKIKLIAAISLLISLIISIGISYLVFDIRNSFGEFIVLTLILLYLTCLINFVFAIQASWIISPIEALSKQRLINKAKVKLHSLEDLKIIGITGSYGKTSMKEILKTVLSESFNVVATKGNFNTPIGVARTLINDVTKDTQILIVEMGEYKKGDVADICKITPPHISIITGINEAHLERYGTMENAISTKFEIALFAQPNVKVYLNIDDELIKNNYQKELSGLGNISFFSSKNNDLSTVKAEDVVFDEELPGISFSLVEETSKEKIEDLQASFLSDYIIGYASAAFQIGLKLGMHPSEIKFALSKIKPFEHRLEPKKSASGVLIIDDTYNGNSNGIKEGIEVLKKFKTRRKVYVTPGLVETGELTKEIHLDIGRWLAPVADLVILTENSVTPFIKQGLTESGFDENKIKWYKTSKETYAKLHENLKEGDVVLMQNDWSDNYY